MLKTTFFYINPHTGLDSPKLDNRNIEEIMEKDDDELEEELDEEAEELGIRKKKKKKKVVEEEDDDSDEEDNDGEEDEDQDEDDEGNSDEEDEGDEDDEEDSEEERKRQKKIDEEEARKKQARESQREALVQRSRNEQFTNKIREAAKIEVTEADLKAEAEKEGLDYELLEPFQKSLLKRTILSERKFNTVSEVVVEEDKLNVWAGKVDEFIDTAKDNPKFARLVGHEQEFKNFSMKESRRGLDFEDLARSFLFDLPAKKKHKGSLLLRGGGGSAPKRKAFTEDDTVAMRKAQPGRLTDLMKRGKVKIDI